MNTNRTEPDQKPLRRSWLPGGLRIGTIRTRLLVAFVLLVLLPATIISVSVVALGLRSGEQQVISQLQSVATLKTEQIDTWLNSLRIHLRSVLYPHQVSRLLDPLLSNEPGSAAYDRAYAELRIQFDEMLDSTELFQEVMLLDQQGRVLLSTNPDSEGQVHAAQPYFWQGLQGSSIQSLSSATAQGLSSPVVVSRPVREQDGTVRGVVMGRASPERLNEIMLQRAGLGETGETYLVGTNFLLLTDSRFEDRDKTILRLQTDTLENVILNRNDGAGLYTNYRDRPVVGVYRWLPSVQMVLVAEQEQAEAFGATYLTLTVNLTIAVVAVLIALISASFLARSIAAPLAGLANTATRIAAGNLNLSARIERNDEVGALAHAFNSMTTRLRQLIGNLEEHVRELKQAEAEVRRVNAHLARDVAEQKALNRLSNVIQRCQTLNEAFYVSVPFLKELFGDCPGVLYRHIPHAPDLEIVGYWGNFVPTEAMPPHDECPIVQGERFTLSTISDPRQRCETCVHYEMQPVLCVQLQTGGEQFGLLHLQVAHDDTDELHDYVLPLAIRTADLLALALSNLQLRENLRDQAIRDPLTGLFNRRFLSETLHQKIGQARRHERTLALLLLDIDYFKRINDTYGHDAGDTVLRAVGKLLLSGLRTEDTACRFGGEEMLLVLTEISVEDVLARAEMLRQDISAQVIIHAGERLPAVTVSIGVAIFPRHAQTTDDLINAADRALYRAKAAGRNQVCMAELAHTTVC